MEKWGFIVWLFAGSLVYLGGTFLVEYWKSKLTGGKGRAGKTLGGLKTLLASG